MLQACPSRVTLSSHIAMTKITDLLEGLEGPIFLPTLSLLLWHLHGTFENSHLSPPQNTAPSDPHLYIYKCVFNKSYKYKAYNSNDKAKIYLGRGLYLPTPPAFSKQSISQKQLLFLANTALQACKPNWFGGQNRYAVHILCPFAFVGFGGHFFFSSWNFHFGVRELLILLSQLYVLFSIVILICC